MVSTEQTYCTRKLLHYRPNVNVVLLTMRHQAVLKWRRNTLKCGQKRMGKEELIRPLFEIIISIVVVVVASGKIKRSIGYVVCISSKALDVQLYSMAQKKKYDMDARRKRRRRVDQSQSGVQELIRSMHQVQFRREDRPKHRSPHKQHRIVGQNGRQRPEVADSPRAQKERRNAYTL